MHDVLMHVVLMHVVLMQGTGELAVRLIIVCESEKRCLSLLARGLRIKRTRLHKASISAIRGRALEAVAAIFVLGALPMVLQVFFEVLALYLNVAPQPHAGYLPALYALMDPALAHPQLPADLEDREQLGGAFAGRGLRRSLPPFEGFFELQERGLQLLYSSAVRFQGSSNMF